MFEDWYGLAEKPFRKTPDPRYLYLSEPYEEALEQLSFAVEEMELGLVTGEVGSGKTLLSRALVDRLGDRFEVGMILNPRLPPRQFLSTAARELGIPDPRPRADELVGQIQDRLLALSAEGRAALLVIDEAHLIPGKPTFEEIRLLTNFQMDDRNLLSVLLVGQPELRERLRHRAYRPLTQRMGAVCHLGPLSFEDARGYITHRLQVAGATRRIFTEEAIAVLHGAAAGIPRVLNHLATQALLEGLARGASEVDEDVARGAVSGQPFLAADPRREPAAVR